MLVRNKNQRTSHLYIQNKTLSYSFAFNSRVCAHIQNIMQENVLFSVLEM